MAVLRPGDAILFIEDGIYHCVQPGLLDKISSNIGLYGQREDLVARGLLDKLETPVETVSYAKFVELCVRHDKIVSWF
jgi:sulfur relay protein TusB/DsrH